MRFPCLTHRASLPEGPAEVRFPHGCKTAAALGTAALMAACGNGVQDADELPPLIQNCNAATCVLPGTAGPTPVSVPNLFFDAGVVVAVVDAGELLAAAVPEAGPGPGFSPVTGEGLTQTNPNLAQPICPATQPTNGAPCDSTLNSVPCNYARVVCTCVITWVCQ